MEGFIIIAFCPTLSYANQTVLFLGGKNLIEVPEPFGMGVFVHCAA